WPTDATSGTRFAAKLLCPRDRVLCRSLPPPDTPRRFHARGPHREKSKDTRREPPARSRLARRDSRTPPPARRADRSPAAETFATAKSTANRSARSVHLSCSTLRESESHRRPPAAPPSPDDPKPT